jgi:hypothetical protein
MTFSIGVIGSVIAADYSDPAPQESTAVIKQFSNKSQK